MSNVRRASTTSDDLYKPNVSRGLIKRCVYPLSISLLVDLSAVGLTTASARSVPGGLWALIHEQTAFKAHEARGDASKAPLHVCQHYRSVLVFE